MIGNLEGGSSPETAKKQLKKLGFESGLQEIAKTSHDDNGRRHDTMVMAVPFSDLGVSGMLELSFYNDRLMVAQFEPDEAGRYWKLLSEHIGKLPEAANQTQEISKDVSLSYYGYYASSGARIRIRWGYTPVLREWQASHSKQSSVFVSHLRRNA
jgi:hypothetical protein